MPQDYDPEDWRSNHICPVHQSPLSFDGSCLHCRSLETALKLSKEVTQPDLTLYEDDEEDYDSP
jgi:hypothetical protein